MRTPSRVSTGHSGVETIATRSSAVALPPCDAGQPPPPRSNEPGFPPRAPGRPWRGKPRVSSPSTVGGSGTHRHSELVMATTLSGEEADSGIL